jgi:exopolysaccharide biosynthesis protein
MRGLGAVNALNLDGGGSTAMAVNGAVVNKPSDATGERPVGDTVQVLP